MNAADRNARVLQSAVFLGPVVVVQAMAWLLGAGPASAPASQPAHTIGLEAALAPYPSPRNSAKQDQALQWLASRPETFPHRSPFHHEPVRTPVQAPPRPEPAPPDAPQAEPVPQLRLTALLGATTGAMAAIDGRIRRVGAEVAPGWLLTEIDIAAECIRIATDSGQSAEIRLRR